MTKIIRYEQRIEKCADCRFSMYLTKTERTGLFKKASYIYFYCGRMGQRVGDLPKGVPANKPTTESNEVSYAYIPSPASIPDFCPLEEVNEKTK